MDYYSILGVKRNASQEEIKKAYRKLAMQHHPDRGGSADKLQQINEAYDVLKDPNKRQQYDNPQPRFDSSHFAHGRPFDFDDIFSEMFSRGNPQARRGPSKNRDIQLSYTLEIKDVFTHTEAFVSYSLPSGKTEQVEIKIPAGVKNGNVIRIAGYGDNSRPMLPRGDLLIKVNIKENKDWRVEGNDLYTTKKCNLLDFLTGTDIIIDTLEDKSINLRIPKGTSPGTTFSITGHGLPNVNNNARGKILVKVIAEVPNITDKELLDKIRILKNEIDTQS